MAPPAEESKPTTKKKGVAIVRPPEDPSDTDKEAAKKKKKRKPKAKKERPHTPYINRFGKGEIEIGQSPLFDLAGVTHRSPLTPSLSPPSQSRRPGSAMHGPCDSWGETWPFRCGGLDSRAIDRVLLLLLICWLVVMAADLRFRPHLWSLPVASGIQLRVFAGAGLAGADDQGAAGARLRALLASLQGSRARVSPPDRHHDSA